MKTIIDDNMITIEADTATCPFEALLYTAHRFSDSLSISFEPSKETKTILAMISKRPGSSNKQLEQLYNLFESELTTNIIKLRILKGTKKTGERILGQVFNSDTETYDNNTDTPLSSDKPEPPDLDGKIKELLDEMDTLCAEAGEDPLDITTPWEEKHGLPKDMDTQSRFPRGIEKPGILKA